MVNDILVSGGVDEKLWLHNTVNHESIGKLDMDSPVRSLLLANSKLFVRTDKCLYCFDTQ